MSAGGMLTNINGVWRTIQTPLVNINGVWRDSDVMVRHNGVWREQHNSRLKERDIIGFRMVYKYVENALHPEFPNLKPNKKVPAEVQLTGENTGSMDLTEKGIVFRYVREGYKDDPAYLGWKDEGLLKYEGRMYAVLTDDTILDIPACTTSNVSLDQQYGSIPYYMTNLFSDMVITLEAWVTYESYGYYMNGWNNLFYKEPFIDPTNYPDKDLHKNIKTLNSYIILPVEKRNRTFDSVASIGIARNMTSAENNMIGSYGALSHTIFNITVNGVPKPFVIELYH